MTEDDTHDSDNGNEPDEMDEADRLDRENELRERREAESKKSAGESKSEDEWDDDYDEDPTDEEFEIDAKELEPEPSKKQAKADVRPGHERAEQDDSRRDDAPTLKRPEEKKAEEKTKASQEKPKTPHGSPPSQQGPTEAGLKSDEAQKTQAPEKPSSPQKLLKVKIDGEEIEIPEAAHEKIRAKLDAAQSLEKKFKETAEDWARRPLHAAMDALSQKLGSREKAYETLYEQANALVEAEREHQARPPEERAAIEAQAELERVRSERDRLVKEREDEERRVEEARGAERLMGEVSEGIKSLGIPVTSDLALRVADILDRVREQGHKPAISDVVRFVASEQKKKDSELANAQAERIRAMSIEDFARAFPEKVKQLRDWDIAEHKRKLSTAKTPSNGTVKVERETGNRSKKVLSIAERDSYFTGW